MRTLRDVSLNKLTLELDTIVSDAMLAMQTHGVAAAAVTKKGNLKGIITIEACILSDSDASIKSILRSAPSEFQINDKIRLVAKAFVRLNADFVAVFDEKKFVGLLSALNLITELGRSWDPLTGLSWSDRLRDWGVDTLESGQEITIIFFDLNDFGAYNKQYGHTIGDRVIIGFGQLLNEVINPKKDVLVRYGGDEFAIGTTRDPDETQSLLAKLAKKSFSVDGVPTSVGYCFGIAGGKRTQEPSRDHVAATLDNLINLASKDCLKNKPKAKISQAVIHSTRSEKEMEIELRFAGPRTEDPSTIRVELQLGEEMARVDQSESKSRYQAIAQATSKAISELNPELTIQITNVAFGLNNGERTVILIGEARYKDSQVIPIATESHLNGDLDRSVAASVLSAAKLTTSIS